MREYPRLAGRRMLILGITERGAGSGRSLGSIVVPYRVSDSIYQRENPGELFLFMQLPTQNFWAHAIPYADGMGVEPLLAAFALGGWRAVKAMLGKDVHGDPIYPED